MAKQQQASLVSDGTLFVSIAHDNRVQLWDAVSASLRQQYKHKDHLSSTYTCQAWGRAPGSKTSRRRQRSEGLGLLAVGTSAGRIIVWDLARAEVLHELGKAGAAAAHSTVRDVAISRAGDRLFSAGDNKHVLEWDVATGGVVKKWSASKHGSSRICLSPNGKQLAIASTSIRVLDTATGSKLHKFTGHASNVQCLAASSDSRFLVSSADDRHISVWDTAHPRDGSVPWESLVVRGGRAVSLQAAASASDLHVLAVLDTGEACVWRCPLSTSGKPSKHGPRKPTCVIRAQGTGATSSTQSYVRAASLQLDSRSGSSSGSLRVVAQSSGQPQFHNVRYIGEDGQWCSQVAVDFAVEESGALAIEVAGEAPGATKKARRQGVEDVVGASSMPLPSIVVDSNGHKPDATGAGGGAGGGAGAGAGAAKKKPPSDAEDVSLTFQQRVEALAASMRSSDEEVAAADEAEEAERAAAGPAARRRLGIAAGSSRGGTGGIDSVQNVLVQALQVQDDSLLEYCLAVSDQRVIKATVARLPTSTVLPFLTRVVRRFEARPQQGRQLAPWLRAVLVQHTAFLMTVPNLLNKLAKLYQTIDARLLVFKKLLKLSGRLDLVLSQVSEREKLVASQSSEGAVFNEGDLQGDESGDDEDESDDESDDEEESGSDDEEEEGDSEESGDDDDDDDDDDDSMSDGSDS